MPGKQAIVYCASIDHSQRVLDAFAGEGINAAHIDAETPKDQRNDIIARFRAGDIKVLSNADLLGEGFDVPACDAVILQRPTKSLALHIQQSMRSMRPAPGKTAYIIDCVGNIETHGLPDEVRGWTLDGKGVRTHGEDETQAALRKCPECGYVNLKEAVVCEMCGADMSQSKPRAEIETVEAKLEEITREERQRKLAQSMKEAREKRYEEARCTSFNDLLRLAQKRGYKPGWAYHRARARGYRI